QARIAAPAPLSEENSGAAKAAPYFSPSFSRRMELEHTPPENTTGRWPCSKRSFSHMASRAFKIHSRQVRATSALEWPVSQSFLHWFSTPDREQSRPLSTALAETGPSHWRASRSRAGPQGKESPSMTRSEEHTSELQSRFDLVCRLLLEKKYT